MSEIDKHFIQQFEAEIYTAFQNKGGIMRGRLRRKTVVGEKTSFPKIGLAPVAQQKARNAAVPIMDIGRDRVDCDLADYYAGAELDNMDELKTNVPERGAIASAISMSMARTEDDISLNALALSANQFNSTGSDDKFVSDTVPRLILEQFGGTEAMDEGNMHSLVSWRAWADLLGLDEFVNAEYGGDTTLTTVGTRPKTFYGIHYMPFSRLPKSGGKPLNIWWNPNTAAVAVGKEITQSTEPQPKFDNTLFWAKMRLGAKIVDDTGVIVRRYEG